MSSDILDMDTDLGKRESNSDAIRRLFPTIEHYYRIKEYKLRSIYGVLIKRGEISMAFQSFRNYYYTERKASTSSNEASSEPSVSNLLSASSISKKSVKREKPEPQPQSDPAYKPRKIKPEVLSLEEEIAAHQAQARAIFEDQ